LPATVHRRGSQPAATARDEEEDVDGSERTVRDPTRIEVEGGGGGLLTFLARRVGERMYRTAALLFLFAILYRYFDAIVHVILIAFVGAILGIAFTAVVTRLPVGRKVGTAILALATLAAIGLGVWFAVTVLAREIRGLVADMPGIMASMDEWETWLEELTGLDLELIGPTLQRAFSEFFGGMEGGAMIAGAFGVVELVAMTLLVLVGAFFIVAKPNEQLLNPLLRTVPREKRDAWRRMFSLLGERLSGWLWGTLLSMLIIAAISSLVFWLLGVPHPILLGTLIGLLDIIPLIGPWIGGAIAVVVTLFYDPGLALWVVIAVVAIQEVEGNLVRPMVMSESAELHPFVTLLALLLFGAMFGLMGAILALPLTLAIGTAVQVLWVEETIGTDEDEIEPLVET
jgi:predicted PurR-regulated permease PerM